MTEFEQRKMFQNTNLMVEHFPLLLEKINLLEQKLEKMNTLEQQLEGLQNQLQEEQKQKLPEFLSATQFCKELGIGYLQFRKLIEKQAIEANRNGKNWKVHNSELRRYRNHLNQL